MNPPKNEGEVQARTEHAQTKFSTIWFELFLVVLLTLLLGLGYLFPTVIRAGKTAKNAKARIEMSNLTVAINQYLKTYGRFPGSANIPDTNSADFTFGTFNTSAAKCGITNAFGYQANNSEIMAILMNWTQFPDGQETPNREYSRNPHRIKFLDLRLVNDTHSPGVGTDGVFRDPWGNPYIITLDTSGDGKCQDGLYQRGEKIMIWSLGPDGKADRSQPTNAGVNRDNVLSW